VSVNPSYDASDAPPVRQHARSAQSSARAPGQLRL